LSNEWRRSRLKRSALAFAWFFGRRRFSVRKERLYSLFSAGAVYSLESTGAVASDGPARGQSDIDHFLPKSCHLDFLM